MAKEFDFTSVREKAKLQKSSNFKFDDLITW
jgi:hypothetical protein